MATPQLNIFITGATGYIGGTIINKLLEHKKRDSFRITALVRDADKARKLNDQSGFHAVVGSTDDTQKLADLAADADVIFSTTNSDDLPATQAILAGTKRHFEKMGVAPALIHTSGTATLCDDAEGAWLSDVVYDDLDIPQLESLPDSAPHRHVDIPVVAADKEGYARTYIVLPTAVWGLATGPLFKAKISNPHSVLLPLVVKQAINRGQVAQFGTGLNKWSHIEIHELGDLYIKLFDAIVDEPEKAGHGHEGYYFGESDEVEVDRYSRAVGEVLVKLDKLTDAEPTPYTKEEVAKYWGGSNALGGNSRCEANRIRKLGWTPVMRTKDMLDMIEDEAKVGLQSL